MHRATKLSLQKTLISRVFSQSVTDQTQKTFNVSQTVQIQVRGSEKRKELTKFQTIESNKKSLYIVFHHPQEQNVHLLIFIAVESIYCCGFCLQNSRWAKKDGKSVNEVLPEEAL